jgi:hypothetical protein
MSGSDSTHPRIFLECKYRDKHATRTLWDATAKLAKRERKSPVVALIDKGRDGFLLAIHSEDLPAVAAEWVAALDDEALDKFTLSVRAARLKNQGEDVEWEEADD